MLLLARHDALLFDADAVCRQRHAMPLLLFLFRAVRRQSHAAPAMLMI
jgi:hypothetical protein